MSQELCRLCLGVHNLKDIFLESVNGEDYSTVLALTTGLRIEKHDGLPQNICKDCSSSVNNALTLRDRALASETKLIQMGYRRRCVGNTDDISATNLEDIYPENLEKSTASLKNINVVLQSNENTVQKTDILDDLSPDRFDFDGFKIEVELDRITQGNYEDQKSEAKNDTYQPLKKDSKENTEAKAVPVQPLIKNSRKEKRQLYLSLVEGEFKRDGPVQCKVCKVTVSKWACFTNHIKKHLGFKFVCEFCGASFISSSQLKRHSRSLHGLRRELHCPHAGCDYLALDNAQLTVHERRAHTGERPYACAECGNAYYSRKCLLQHTESHREGATVQCEQCPLRFKSRRHLAKHRYGAHGDKRRARRQRTAAARAAAATAAGVDGGT